MIDIPENVVLRGIPYRVSQHEGCVVFSDASGFWGLSSRMVFSKPKHALWQIDEIAGNCPLCACHVVAAYELLVAVCPEHPVSVDVFAGAKSP